VETGFTLQNLRAATAAGRFSFVSGIGAAVSVVRNLSGIESPLARLLVPSVVHQRVDLVADDGEPLTVEISGSPDNAGRPIVLVHGLGGSHDDWNDAVASLAREHRVYTLDLRGHGARAHARFADTRPTLAQMARDVALVIERLAIERPVLAGHSMGALVVMQYVRDFGAGAIAGVCFVDMSPRITNDDNWSLGLFGSLSRPQLQAALARLRGDFVETVIAEIVSGLALARKVCGRHYFIGRMLRRLLARIRITPLLSILDSVVDADFRDLVAGLPVPALVVLGGISHHYAGLPLADYYEQTLPVGEVRMFVDSAHSPHRQEPTRFARTLSAFVADRCG
jgi:pimeloyl-ACP methyl ester carboxylesterase